MQLQSNDGKSTVKGELVVETMSHWQLAIGGKVSAFAKTEWKKDIAADLLSTLFPTHYPFKA